MLSECREPGRSAQLQGAAEQANIEVSCSAAFGDIAEWRCCRAWYAVAGRPLSESLAASVKSRLVPIQCVGAGALDEAEWQYVVEWVSSLFYTRSAIARFRAYLG
jgi:hypothetical protein